MLESADSRKFIMMSASHSQGETRGAEGIVTGHAYSLISTHRLKHGKNNNRELRLIKLRNPWGSGEWTGSWSDGSPLWTPELKE